MKVWAIKSPDGGMSTLEGVNRSRDALWGWFEPWTETREILKRRGFRAVRVEIKEIKRRKF